MNAEETEPTDETVGEEAELAKKKALKTIGRLVVEERNRQRLSQISLSKLAGVDVKTVRSLEEGTRLTQGPNRAKIEETLGWRIGAMQTISDKPAPDLDFDALTPDDMKIGDPAKWPKERSRAADLTTAELLVELGHRIRTMEDRIAELEQDSVDSQE